MMKRTEMMNTILQNSFSFLQTMKSRNAICNSSMPCLMLQCRWGYAVFVCMNAIQLKTDSSRFILICFLTPIILFSKKHTQHASCLMANSLNHQPWRLSMDNTNYTFNVSICFSCSDDLKKQHTYDTPMLCSCKPALDRTDSPATSSAHLSWATACVSCLSPCLCLQAFSKVIRRCLEGVNTTACNVREC